MTDKFDYTETGQSDAIAYIESLGATGFSSAFEGQTLDGNNAVAYANFVYAKLNPTKPTYITEQELYGTQESTEEEKESSEESDTNGGS